MRIYKLNSRGFTHVIAPLLVFVALFAIAGGYYYLRDSHAATVNSGAVTSGWANMCLDDYQDGNGNAHRVDLWGCNKTAAQDWQVNSNETISINSGNYCLGVNAPNGKITQANPAVELFSCRTTTAALTASYQQWKVSGTSLVNVHSGMCLDVPGATLPKAGTNAELADCSTGKSGCSPTPKAETECPQYITTPRIITGQVWHLPSTTSTGTGSGTPAPTSGSGSGGSSTGSGGTSTGTGTTTSQSCTSPAYSTSSNSAWTNGGYTVQQDMWNNTAGGTQSLYACSYSNWYVVAKQPNTSSVKTYPDVLKNYDNAINSFHTLSTSYADQGPHVGTYEFAYDIWINGMASSGATELMIWNDNYNQYPAGSKMGQTTIGSTTYNVYKGPMNNWTYIAFVPVNATITSGTDNLLSFFSYMSGNGWISTSAVLKQIDYGVEICSTDNESATFKVTNFSITSS